MHLLTRWVLAAVAGMTVSWSEAGAQAYIVRGDGWEAFPGVEYQGGDSRFTRKLAGILVLTDSTLALYPCRVSGAGGGCAIDDDDKKLPWKEPAFFVIRLEAMETTSSSSQVRGPDAASRIMLGALAGDRVSDYVRLVHEVDGTVEAPLFRVHAVQSGAIEAKIAHRLRKLREASP